MSKPFMVLLYVSAGIFLAFCISISPEWKSYAAGSSNKRPVVPEASEFTAIKHDTRSALDLWVITDEVSVCQYIFAKFSGSSITPRLDANGKQICRKVTP